MADIDLSFIARQNERILADLRAVRDELHVNSAMVQRCSNAVTDQAATLNAIHQWMINMNDRVRNLEGQQP